MSEVPLQVKNVVQAPEQEQSQRLERSNRLF